MPEYALQNLIYLGLLLAFIGYFTLGGYRGNWPKAGKHILVWLAIFASLFVIIRLLGYSATRCVTIPLFQTGQKASM